MKTIKTKIYVNNQEDKNNLHYFIENWNNAVASLCRFLIDCRNGSYGQEGIDVFNVGSARTTNTCIFNYLTQKEETQPRDKDSCSDATLSIHTVANNFKKKHIVPDYVFDARWKNCVDIEMWGQIHKMALGKIKSYDLLLKMWKKENKENTETLNKFLNENALFAKIIPEIEKFTSQYGSIKRRNRYVRFVDFLLNNKNIENWDNSNSVIRKPTDDEMKSISKHRKNYASKYISLIRSINPSIDSLFYLYKTYENICNLLKKKAPSLTFSSSSHIDWPTFQASSDDNKKYRGYKNLNFKTNSFEIKIFDINNKQPYWLKCYFINNNQTKNIQKLQQKISIDNSIFTYRYFINMDQILLQPQRLSVKYENESFYLLLSCETSYQSKDEQKYVNIQRKMAEKENSLPYAMKVLKNNGIKEFRVLAIDQSMSHNGGFTVSDTQGNITNRFVLKDKGVLPFGQKYSLPSVNEINHVYKQLKYKRKITNNSHGIENSNRYLQNRYNNLRKDRAKQKASITVKIAKHYGCNIIAIEDLNNLKSRASQPRNINRSLNSWGKEEYVRWLNHMAAENKIVVVKIKASNTSQYCPRCDCQGRRFNKVHENNLPENYSNKYFKTKQDYAYFDKCGKWFVCGNKKCGNIMNADILASENIQRKFRNTFPSIKRKNDKEYKKEQENIEKNAKECLVFVEK